VPVTKLKPLAQGELVFIAQTILGADAATITLTGLPVGFKDLVVVFKLRSTRAATTDDGYLRVGTGSIDTGAHYSDYTAYAGSGGGAVGTDSTRSYLSVLPGASINANVYTLGEITIYDYLSTVAFKKMTGVGMFCERNVLIYASTTVNAAWNQPTAIDQFQAHAGTGPNLKAGSFLTVYGRK
jgi:hypothetical protein